MSIKLLITGRRPVGMTTTEHHDYMRYRHGADVLHLIATQPDVAPRRYVQNHAFDSSRSAGPADDHLSLGRDFVTQVWFDDPAHMSAALNAPEYLDHLHPDEDNFVDQGTVVVLPVTESVRLPRPISGSTTKLFLLHRTEPTADAVEAADAESSDRWDRRLDQPGHGVAGLVRNRVLKDPAVAEAHLVDEVWFTSDTAARAMARTWLDTDPCTVAVLTREHVLHEGSSP